jgi:hypothetical protein
VFDEKKMAFLKKKLPLVGANLFLQFINQFLQPKWPNCQNDQNGQNYQIKKMNYLSL